MGRVRTLLLGDLRDGEPGICCDAAGLVLTAAICIHSSRALINVSQVALSSEVASSNC